MEFSTKRVVSNFSMDGGLPEQVDFARKSSSSRSSSNASQEQSTTPNLALTPRSARVMQPHPPLRPRPFIPLSPDVLPEQVNFARKLRSFRSSSNDPQEKSTTSRINKLVSQKSSPNLALSAPSSPQNSPRRTKPHRPLGPRPSPQNSPLLNPVSAPNSPRRELPHLPSESSQSPQDSPLSNSVNSAPNSPRRTQPHCPPGPSPHTPRETQKRYRHITDALFNLRTPDKLLNRTLAKKPKNIDDVRSSWTEVLKIRDQCKLNDVHFSSLTKETLTSFSDQLNSNDCAVVVTALYALGYRNRQDIVNLIERIEVEGIEEFLTTSPRSDIVDFLVSVVKFEHRNIRLVQPLFAYVMEKLTNFEEMGSKPFTCEETAKIMLAIAESSYRDEALSERLQSYVLSMIEQEPNSFKGSDFVKILLAFSKFGYYEANVIHTCINSICNSMNHDELNGKEYAKVILAIVKLQSLSKEHQQPIEIALIQQIIVKIDKLLKRSNFFNDNDIVKIAWGFAKLHQMETLPIVINLLGRICNRRRDDDTLHFIYETCQTIMIAAPGIMIPFSPQFESQFHEYSPKIQYGNYHNVAVNQNPVVRDINIWSPQNSPQSSSRILLPPARFQELDELVLPAAMRGLSIQEGKSDEEDENDENNV